MKKINLFVPKYRKEEIYQELDRCFDAGWTGMGFITDEFEQMWSEYTKLTKGHFISSNTIGLELVLKMFKDIYKWSDDSEIITTPLTFISTNHAILHSKMKPVFADVNKESLCLGLENIKRVVTRKTKAIMFVGLGGNIGEFNEISAYCRANDLKLILDAAHMAGSRFTYNYDGMIEGDVHAGYGADATIFSFQSVKNLPTADSGMVQFNNPEFDNILRKWSWLGIDKDTFNRTNSKGSYKWDYDVVNVGSKANGNSVMAALAKIGLKYLDEDNSYRRRLASIYSERLLENERITLIQHRNAESTSQHLCQVLVDKRNEVMVKLNKKGIYPGVHYKDNTLYSMYRNAHGSCPVSHFESTRIISLPLHLNLLEDDVHKVCDVLESVVCE